MDRKFESLCAKLWIYISLTVILQSPISISFTDEQDVFAMNSLYTSLGSPAIPGWTANGGDPCAESWQGVGCVNSNITSITINAANLGGELGNNLGNFSALITIDLSNNNIGGSIPENLPVTVQQLFLSANQLSGSIPDSLSQLTQLVAMSLNGNHLDGPLPDSFQSLNFLTNLDISLNNLSGPLPPSMSSLSSLTSLHIQDNQFSGFLTVLEDLPLKDLNIENNLFSGPVPEKLLNIPNFKKEGNPFNTSIAPSAQPPATRPFFGQPAPPPKSRSNTSDTSSGKNNTNSNNSTNSSSSSSNNNNNKSKNTSTLKIVGYVLVAVVSFIVIVLMVIFCLSKYQERRSRESEYSIPKTPPTRVNNNGRVDQSKTTNDPKKVSKERSESRQQYELGRTAPETAMRQYSIDIDEPIMPPPPPPPLPPPPPPPPPPEPVITAERVIVNPIGLPGKNEKSERVNLKPSSSSATSATSFSVAALQQYTRSFHEEILIRESRLGKVYLAELPHGELLEVMKLDNVNSKIPVDEFLELVANLSEINHPNILELVGYCAEFGQRLLVYRHFSRRSLQDVLHYEDDPKRSLSWNSRLKIALGAAKALEYLHEGCQPLIVHQNFEPANILLDKKMSVRVSECGLAQLMSANSVTQLSGRMRSLYSYEAPEINESGSSFTDHSDVYSFGVVMLELLTGRKPYDMGRPRGEQHLVRWASSQLHDIEALTRMLDPSIRGMCSDKSLSRFADIISRCIQHEPEFRPPMSEIVQDLTRMVNDMRDSSK